MPHSFGRAIDDTITEFRQRLAAERKTHVAEMQKEIIAPLQAAQKEIIAPLRALQAEVTEMSRDLAQLRAIAKRISSIT